MAKAKDEMTLRERAVFLLNPKRGGEMFRERLKGKRADVKMAATGYGNHGASTTLNSMVGWLAGGGSAEDDIDLQGSTLRVRARDLYAGGGLARSGPDTLTTSVVGWGIKPKPKIDGELLGMSDEACGAWERNTLREFTLWADSVMCDAARQQNFFGLQELAFRSYLVSGDVFALFGMKENPRTPYQTTIRLIEADRVSTPDSSGDESESKETDSGGRIVDGVEIDAEGEVIRYHIASYHPLMENSSGTLSWTAIDAFGKDTGAPNILHIMAFERPEQRRGIPFVAAQIELIKQLDRYISSELSANVVSSMLAGFLESDDDGTFGMEDAINADEKVTDDEFKIELAPGVFYQLPAGKHLKEFNPLRNNTAFEPFIDAMETFIGAGGGIPKEVLIKKYDSNYTAARGALLDFWRLVRVYRTRFNAAFNQPIYEQWLAEAVAIGRVEAPGFFEDPAIRRAYCGCVWMGASMGHVDPLKEVNAAEKRIANNISTEEQEAAEYNGNDWLANVRQRKKERAMFSEDAAQSRTGGVPTDKKEEDK